MRMLISLAMLSLVGSSVLAQAPVPKGDAPGIGLASAVEKDGKVIIEVFELREVIRMKIPDRGAVFIEKRHWLPLTTGTLNRDMRAYRQDGKLATPREVMTALHWPVDIAMWRCDQPRRESHTNGDNRLHLLREPCPHEHRYEAGDTPGTD
jgi:hypothetical protein